MFSRSEDIIIMRMLLYFIFADGEVYSWGQNSLGQLGIRLQSSQQREPVLVSTLLGAPVILIVAGGYHSAALSQAGFLATWGSNKYGQLGYKTDNDTNCR